jgi:hypothetical protein
MEAARAAEVIRERCASPLDAKIFVFWIAVEDSRTAYKTELIEAGNDLRLAVLVPRKQRFDNANALLEDLRDVLCDNQEEVLAAFHSTTAAAPLVVALLSHRHLELPQIASPMTMPVWIPDLGGREVSMEIEDLTRTAEASVACVEARIADVAEALYLIEQSLVRRFAAIAELPNHQYAYKFFDLIKETPKPDAKAQKGSPAGAATTAEKFVDFVAVVTKSLAEVHEPRGYRPSARDAKTISGRLLRLVSRSSPDELGARAKALASLFAIGGAGRSRELLVTVLLRPTMREDPATRFARNLLVTIYSASQFVTAAAHADDYPRYPIEYLRYLSHDLRRVLKDVSELLDASPPPSAP